MLILSILIFFITSVVLFVAYDVFYLVDLRLAELDRLDQLSRLAQLDVYLEELQMSEKKYDIEHYGVIDYGKLCDDSADTVDNRLDLSACIVVFTVLLLLFVINLKTNNIF